MTQPEPKEFDTEEEYQEEFEKWVCYCEYVHDESRYESLLKEEGAGR